MGWERARTESQKRTRSASILDAALALLRLKPLHAITLSDIAKNLSFTRANLYKYFESKEEVYLALLADRITECGRDARGRLPTQQEITSNGRVTSFTAYWVELLSAHAEMLTLLSVAGSILEKNCSDRILVQSKRAMAEAIDRDFVFSLMTFFPGREQDAYRSLISHLVILANGLHSACGLSEEQRALLTQEGLSSMCRDFQSVYTEQTRFIVDAWINAHISANG